MEIRLARLEDAPACLEIYTPVVLETAISFELTPPTAGELSSRMADVLSFAPWLVCQNGDRTAGYAYASRFRARPAYQWSVEVTVYVGSQWRKNGIAAALYKNLLDCLRAQGFVNAYAIITLPNPGSVALHEKLGFGRIGILESAGYKLDQWHDLGWWHLRLMEPAPDPAPPLPLEKVLPGRIWQPPQ